MALSTTPIEYVQSMNSALFRSMPAVFVGVVRSVIGVPVAVSMMRYGVLRTKWSRMRSRTALISASLGTV